MEVLMERRLGIVYLIERVTEISVYYKIKERA
jgi:hypothetical protein